MKYADLSNINYDGVNETTSGVADYSLNADPKTILKDPRFLKDLRDYYAEKNGEYYESDDALVEQFYSDGTWRDLNTLGAVGGALDAYTSGKDDRERMKRIEGVWRTLPFFWQDGGRGSSALPDIGKAIIADPLNIIPGAAAFKAGTVAARSAQLAGKSPIVSGALSGAGKGALVEGGISGAQEAIVNTATQARDLSLGLRDEFSGTDLATATGIGTVLGGGVGGAIGAGAGVAGAARGADQVDNARRVGLTDDQIARMSNEDIEAFTNNTRETDFVLPDTRTEEPVQTTTTTEPVAPIDDIEAAKSALQVALRVSRNRYINAVKNGEAADEIKKLKKERDELAMLDGGILERLKREDEQIKKLEQDETRLDEAKKLRTRFEDDFAKLRILIDGDFIDDVAVEAFDADLISRGVGTDRSTPNTAENIKDEPLAETEVKTEETTATSPTNEAVPEASADATPSSTTPTTTTATTTPEPTKVALDDDSVVNYNTDAQKASIEKIIADSNGAYTKENFMSDFRAGLFPVKGNGKLQSSTPGLLRERVKEVQSKKEFEDAKDTKPEAEVEAEIDNGVVASPEVRGRLLANGIDWRDIAPAEKSEGNRITKKTATRAIKNKTEESVVAQQANQDLEDALNEISLEINDPIEVRKALVGIVQRKSNADDILDLFDHHVGKFNDPNLKQELFTTTEKKQIRRLIKSSKERGIPENTAQFIAEQKILENRGVPAKSGERTTQKAIDDKSVYETAGRNNDGGIQSFLKRSNAYGVDGRYRVDKTSFTKDEAILKAQAKNKSDLVPYVTTGREAVKTARGDITVEAGTTVFADAKTGRSYATMKDALIMRGDMKPNTPKKETSLEDVTAQFRALVEANKDDPDTLLDALRAFKKRTGSRSKSNSPAEEIAETESASAPPTRGDKVLIVQSKSDPNDVRMMGRQQIDDGKDISAIIGKSGDKSNPDNWIVKYAPMSAIGTRSRALKKLFDTLPVEEVPTTATATGARLEVGGQTGTAEPLDIDDFNKLIFTLTEGEVNELRGLGREIRGQTNLFAKPDGKGNFEITGQMFRHITTLTESLRWGRTLRDHKVVTDTLGMLYGVQARQNPQGYKLTNVQRKDAIDKIDEMFSPFSKEEISDAKEFLTRLGGDKSIAPQISSPDIEGRTAYFNPNSNNINFDRRRPNNLQPRISTLYHETAHWAYHNILTPEDRLYFWDSMKKYYNGEEIPFESGNYTLNRGQVEGGLYLKPGEEIELGGTTHKVHSNAMDSPAEFFANQFEMWVSRNNNVAIKDQAFWSRVTRYVKAIYDRYFTGAKIDPDLEPLFAKILPEAEEKKFALGVDSTPTTKEGKVIQGRYVMADFNKNQMEEAISAKDSDGIITAFDEFRKYLLGVAKNDGEGATGALLALRMGRRGKGALKIIRQRINDMDEIMYGKRVQDTAFGEEKFNPSAYDDLTLTANPDDVANTLSDFYYNGYQGSFTPELGLPGKVNETNIDKTNIPSLVKIIQTRLNARYQQIEETTNLIPGSKPETTVKTISVRDNGRVEPSGTKGKILNEKVIEDERIDAQAQADAKTTRTKRVKKSSTGRHQTDGSVSAEVKSESLASLRTLYKKHKGSDYGDQVAMEITSKIKAQKLPSKQVPITRAVMESSGAELEQGYLNAIANNNTKDMNMFGYEMQRRIAKKNAKKKGVDFAIKPIFLKSDVFTRELNDNTGVMTNDGIPPASRSSIREALSYITHRNPEMNTAGRTMAYRLFNIMNRTAKGTLEDANQLTLADISRLGKKNYIFEEDIPFSDFKSAGFNEFRNTIRRTSRTFHAGDAEASGAVKEVMGMIGRATLNNEQKTALLDFYRQVKPSVAERFFSKQDTNLPDQLKEEYASVDLFTEVMTEIIDSRNTKNIDDFLEDMVNDGVPPSLLNTWIRTGDEVTEYTAYVLNGNIGSKKAKENFQRLDVYGDMFSHGKKPMHGTLDGYHLTHPSYAADYAFDTLQSMPKARLSKLNKFVRGGFGHDQASDMPIMFYHGTPNGTKLKKVNNPDVIFKASSDGRFGNGYYLTLNPHVASQTYASNPTTLSLLRQVDNLDIPREAKQDLDWDIRDIQADRNEVSKLRQKYNDLGDNEFETQEFIDAERGDIAAKIQNLMTSIRGLELEVQKKGIVIDPMVMPMVIDMKKPLDLRDNSNYDLQFDEMPRAVLAKIVEKELLNPKSIENLASEMGLSPQVSGNSFYYQLIHHLQTASRSQAQAQRELNNVFQELGYDGLVTTHQNVLGDAGAETLDISYSGTRTAHTTVVLFEPNQAKHIDAEFFDSDDARMYNNVTDAVPIPRGTMGAVTEGLMLNQISGVSDIPTGQFGELLEQNGTNATLTGAMMSMIKKRNLNATEEQAVRKRSAFTYFQSQSERMKSMGANYLSNFYKNHFPDMNQRFASKFMPIANALAKLDDADGILRGYFRKTTASIGQKQPKSHQNIVRALRRGDGSRQEKALSADERNIYKQIRSMFAGERQELVDAGYHVGDRGPNYLPQVWDAKKILKDKDVFMDKMKRYYMRERMDNGFQVREDEANAFAEGLMITLTKEGDDGVFVPVRGTTRNPTFENVDYSRVIALEKYPDMLDELEQYLEADLNGLLVKYVEGSSRRVTHAKKLGVNSHGVYDYLAVAADGEGGIARLLSTNKIFKKDLTAMTENGRVEVATIVDTIRMPFEGDEQGAGEFARQLINAYNTQGTAAARKMLEDLPVSGTAGKPSQTYARRVDAIVGALEDYKGKAQSIEPQDEKFIESAMQVAMKKPLTAFGGKGMVNTSRAIRMTNNVTLLGFTTLTSLGDVVLPIIRSGSFSSWAKGLGKWATDPEYRVMLKNVGVAMENIVHERMVHMYGAPDNKASHAFFNATLLTPWTDMNRSIAGATGFETFKAMQIKARDQFKENLPYAQQNAKYKTAHRFLNNYGLNAFLPGGKRSNESLGNMDLMKDDTAMRMAIIKFADDSIFQPNPNDVPLWAQTPIGALVFQLKSFPLMMTRLSGHVLSEANKGNVKPLMYLGLLGPAFGAVTLSAKDVIQQRGGEDGQSAELRKRNIAKALGHDEKTHGNVDDFLGWYVEGMLVMGGLGLMGDVIHSTVSQVDNGAYGQQRIWSTLLGPSYGLGNAVTNVAAGAFDENESNAKERSATRELATRIPILGGNRKFRETVVDGIAGESSTKSNGWSSSWGSDWK